MTNFKFKDVDFTFNFKKLPQCDQDYLRSMAFETVQEKSVNHSGLNFGQYYPSADNFTLFKDEKTMINYMVEFVSEYSNTASHMLDGKKYHLAWTHNKRQ